MWVTIHSPVTASHTIMTTTRIYNFYPTLTDQKVNLVLSEFAPRCSTLCYSFGYRTYKANSEFFRDCPVNCPVRTRRTKNLPGISVIQWGSPTSLKDQGKLVSATDGYKDHDFTWSMSRSCNNHMCIFFSKWISLHKELYRPIPKGDSDGDASE